jgi:hypothetical protein
MWLKLPEAKRPASSMRTSSQLFDVQGKLATIAGDACGQAGSFDSVSAKADSADSFLQNVKWIPAISRHAVCDPHRRTFMVRLVRVQTRVERYGVWKPLHRPRLFSK